MTEIPVIAHELMRVATGNALTVRTLDGEDVTLRLATADELMRFEQEARAKLADKGIVVDLPPMSRERAEELAGPLRLGDVR